MTVRRRQSQGLTLIELLIAMTLVSIMLVLLFGALRMATRSWDAAEHKREVTEERRLISGFLRQIMRGIQPLRYNPPDSFARPVIAGQADAFEFVADVPEVVGMHGLYLIRLQFFDAGESRELVMQRWLFLPKVLEGDTAAPAWKSIALSPPPSRRDPKADQAQSASVLYGERVLLQGVREGVFQFAGMDDDSLAQWQDGWDDDTTMPAAVKLTMTFDDGDWPDLIMPLPAEGAAAIAVRRAGIR